MSTITFLIIGLNIFDLTKQHLWHSKNEEPSCKSDMQMQIEFHSDIIHMCMSAETDTNKQKLIDIRFLGISVTFT